LKISKCTIIIISIVCTIDFVITYLTSLELVTLDSNAHVEKDYRAHTTEMSSPSRNQKKNLADSDIRQTLQKPGWPTAYSYFYYEDWMMNERVPEFDSLTWCNQFFSLNLDLYLLTSSDYLRFLFLLCVYGSIVVVLKSNQNTLKLI